jgi:hypothetical protein
MLTLACTSPLAQDDEAGTTTNPGTTDDDTTDEASEATGTGTSTGTSSSTSTGTTESFVVEPDVFDPEACSVFDQDCPEGEKCVPYGSSGDSWDALKCVPVLGDQAPGEPCVWAGIIEATDDCDASSICWFAEEIEGQFFGTCVAQCTGTPDMPECLPGASCILNDNGSLALCLPGCDPVVQDCGEELACYWGGAMFECIFTSENIPTGEPCGFVNDCAPGHLCADAAALPSCAGSACCTQYCNLLDGDAGCSAQPGTACVSFFDEGRAPVGYEHIGACVLPP